MKIVEVTILALLHSSQNWPQIRINAGFDLFRCAVNCGFQGIALSGLLKQTIVLAVERMLGRD
ncbi:MAG: hypothetical protein LBF16_01990 [Pseudomonadales bacterium]|nr:hypothetical protein [Pseudomonadales bacterium]